MNDFDKKYFNKPGDLNARDSFSYLNRLDKAKYDPRKKNDLAYSFAQDILYKAASNPGKN